MKKRMEGREPLVFIVDDQPENITALRKFLCLNGYKVMVVETAAAAMASLKTTTPDILLIDLFLGTSSGLDLCGRIRSNPDLADIPVLFFSGADEGVHRVSALHLGARDFISKSCEPNEFVARIGLHLKLAENERLLKRKNAELSDAYGQLQTTQDQVVQAEKLATLGRLAVGVAHEISTPMSFVASNLRGLATGVRDLGRMLDAAEDVIALCADGAPQEPIKERVAAFRRLEEEIQADTLRQELDSMCRESLDGMEMLVRLAGDLREFSRDDKHDLVSTDINVLIEKALSLARTEIGSGIAVKHKRGELPPVRCIPSRITQVFLILIVNAFHAMQGKGTLSITTSFKNGRVRAVVGDTGTGIPPEHLGRVFDPFFTTKPAEKGTGLGLTIAQKILNFHGGGISVASELGKGTRMTVEIPLASDGAGTGECQSP